MLDQKENAFPTEMVELPSKGHFYTQENPLSSGKVEIKYMTAREEDILTSASLIKKGVVLNKLLESLIVTEGVDLNTMLLGDKNAVLIAARILGYGKEYNVAVMCPNCGETEKTTVDLTSFNHKEVNLSEFDKGINSFAFTLPSSKVTIRFRLLSHADEQAISTELKATKKFVKGSGVDSEVTTRLKHVITSINGEEDTQKIRSFIDNDMLSRDSLAFRKHLASFSPDVDMKFDLECNNCDEENRITVPMTAEFFWPAGE